MDNVRIAFNSFVQVMLDSKARFVLIVDHNEEVHTSFNGRPIEILGLHGYVGVEIQKKITDSMTKAEAEAALEAVKQFLSGSRPN